jgi:hypothetical protein
VLSGCHDCISLPAASLHHWLVGFS